MPTCDALLQTPPARAALPRREFRVEWARSQEDVREAQRLRYRVFAQEMGARLAPATGAPGLDVDRFDAFCDHLLVRNADGGEVIGTYRVLAPSQAREAGGYYSDSEFDLGPLASLRPRAVELGRSCVDSGWRLGGVIMVMWTALGAYMVRHDLDTMIGCASIGLADGALPALALWEGLRHTHLAAPQWQVRPHRALAGASLDESPSSPIAPLTLADAPPLIKGYLRCGARVLGPPALDAEFNTADLPMMLRLQDMARRYRKHFIGSA